jgi:hypothetical protein
MHSPLHQTRCTPLVYLHQSFTRQACLPPNQGFGFPDLALDPNSRNRGALLAGEAKIDITPQDLTGLTNLWRHPFEGVHDQIYVRALVLCQA